MMTIKDMAFGLMATSIARADRPESGRGTDHLPRLLQAADADEARGICDRLRDLYAEPGPYVSVHLDIEPGDSLASRWAAFRRELAHDVVPAALEAVDSHVATAEHSDGGAIGIVAATSGATVVGRGLVPVGVDRCDVAEVPDVGTLIEWEQQRIPHLVVEMDDAGATITRDGLSPHAHSGPSLTLIGTPAQLARDLAARVDAADAQLVVITGHQDQADELASALADLVHPLCRVIADPDVLLDGPGPPGARYVLDTSREIAGSYLREFRMLRTHDAAVEGIGATIDALRCESPDVLLMANPGAVDEPSVWVGEDPVDVSVLRRERHQARVPFTRAAIRAAIAQDIRILALPAAPGEVLVDDVGAISIAEIRPLVAGSSR